MKWGIRKNGFTIVELLIVVVVIAILAAITIVAFNGIQQRANNSSVMSDVDQAVKKIETKKLTTTGELYPADQTASQVQASPGSTISYFYNATSNGYCVQVVKGTISYYASNGYTKPTSGTCSTYGLLGWWDLNGNSNDQSGNANNGTASNTSLEVGQNGQANNAYGFNGTSSQINVPTTVPLSTDVQTFAFWVYPNSWATPTASALLAKRTSSTQGWFIGYLVSSSALFFDCGSSSAGNRWTTTYNPPLSTWTHLVFTCSTTNGVALYVNGALHSSRPTVDRSALSSITDLRFGRDSAGTGLLYLNGRMDDVRLYDREFTLGDATALYNLGGQ